MTMTSEATLQDDSHPFLFFFFEDVSVFPASGSVMDSNAAKEMIHSCPITT